METDKNASKPAQIKKMGELHGDCKHWKSVLRFMQDEITFIDRLLNSYVFEPNTPNLFERLQDYLGRVSKAKARNAAIEKQIAKHENNLGGILECKGDECDKGFYQKHNVLKAEVVSCLEDFQYLKNEIFNYAGGILKKRKPTKYGS